MKPRIVILGGGFAGMSTARELERSLSPGEAHVTMVSRENFSLFTPMLPEVGSGNVETRHIVTPVRAQLKMTEFVLADVIDVDLERRLIACEHTITGDRIELPYDQLVIGLGSVTSTFGLPGIAERALPYKTLEDAARLRNHVIAMLELAAVATDDEHKRRLLTFAFVGGGFTGVEAAGETADFFESSLRFYPSIDPLEIRIFLIEGGPKLLPDLQAGMGEYCSRALGRRGIEVLLDTLVAGADDRGLSLAGGRIIATSTIVWSAGVKPSPVVAGLTIANGRGGAIVVNRDLSVPNHSGVWALGDCARIPNPKGGDYPATAQHALREGPLLARNIRATLRGEPTKPFAFDALGMMASIGARRGVAGIRGKLLITGFPAWFLWRTYYLFRLPGIDRQFRVAFDWALGLIFPRDIAELRVFSRLADQRATRDEGMVSHASESELATETELATQPLA